MIFGNNGKSLTLQNLFYLKPIPFEQESLNLGSWAQKRKRVCKCNNFEVSDLRPEIDILPFRSWDLSMELLAGRRYKRTMSFSQGMVTGLN